MGFKAGGQWRSMVRQLREKQRSFATASNSSMDSAAPHHNNNDKYALTGEFAPIYILAGFTTVVIGMALHTAKQQLLHSPQVSISKKRRELIAEVDIPDTSVANAHRFISKSFLRKVAHIQDPKPTLPHSSSSPFPRFPQAETLKTVGVNPRDH